MIYLINQGVRQAAGYSRGCVGVGVGVEVAKLAALPSQQQSVGEVSLNRAIIVGDTARFGGRAKASEVGGCCFVEPPSTSSGCDDQTRQTKSSSSSSSSGRNSHLSRQVTLRVSLSVQGDNKKTRGLGNPWAGLCCLLEEQPPIPPPLAQGRSSHQHDALSVHEVQVVLPKWYPNLIVHALGLIVPVPCHVVLVYRYWLISQAHTVTAADRDTCTRAAEG